MQVLRRPETAQGQAGFWESGASGNTRTADLEVAHAIRSIRGENYFTVAQQVVDLYASRWHGAEADVTADPRAVARARSLLESIPHGYELPEIAVDPDGDVAFDWIRRDRTLISLSIGKSNYATYAARLRDGSAYGTVKLGDGFPGMLADLIRRLYHPI